VEGGVEGGGGEVGRLEEGVRAFVLDFSNVEYLNSMNIAAIIALRSRLEKRGAQLALANLREQVVSIFRVLKLERLFALDHDLDRALEAVAA